MELPPTQTLHELLHRARDGSEQAWATLYQVLKEDLRRLIERQLQQQGRDLLRWLDHDQPSNELWERLWAELRRTMPEDRRALRAIVGKLATNLRVDYFRELKVRQKGPGHAYKSFGGELQNSEHLAAAIQRSPGVAEPALGATNVELVEAIEQLTGMQGEVVRLHHWEYLTFEQIGLELGIATGSAHKLYREALTELRRILGGDQ